MMWKTDPPGEMCSKQDVELDFNKMQTDLLWGNLFGFMTFNFGLRSAKTLKLFVIHARVEPTRQVSILYKWDVTKEWHCLYSPDDLLVKFEI